MAAGVISKLCLRRAKTNAEHARANEAIDQLGDCLHRDFALDEE